MNFCPGRKGALSTLSLRLQPLRLIGGTLGLVTDLGGIGVELSGIVVNRRSPADAGEFLADRRQREDEHVSRLRSAVPTVPLAQLPLTATEPTGVGGITGLAALLAER